MKDEDLWVQIACGECGSRKVHIAVGARPTVIKVWCATCGHMKMIDMLETGLTEWSNDMEGTDDE